MKWALITGASRGIGASTAVEVSKQGYAIIGTYREKFDEIKKVEEECVMNGASAFYPLQLDLMKSDSIRTAVGEIREITDHGPIDLYVCNAGRLISSEHRPLTVLEQAELWQTNYLGPRYLTEKLYKGNLHPHKSIFIGSNLCITEGDPFCEVYIDTKNALRQFVAELAALHHFVYCVNPDRTRTDMTGHIGDRSPEEVARVIYETSVHGYNKPYGSDINVWEILKSSD